MTVWIFGKFSGFPWKMLESKALLSHNFFHTILLYLKIQTIIKSHSLMPRASNLSIFISLSLGSFELIHVAYYICNWSFAAVSESPSSVSTPVTAGMPISFTMSADGTGGEFHIDISSSKSEKRKSRPPRPPPPGRRLSARPASEIQIESEAVDGIRPRTTSVPNMDSGPPDSISCVRFACTFTKKNGKLSALLRGRGTYIGQGKMEWDSFCGQLLQWDFGDTWWQLIPCTTAVWIKGAFLWVCLIKALSYNCRKLFLVDPVKLMGRQRIWLF